MTHSPAPAPDVVILDRGFRPFFLLAAAFGAAALTVWLWVVVHGATPPLAVIDARWHVHEMINGYLLAVLAGFVLTALPSWTGRPPVRGLALALLVALWIAARAVALKGPDSALTVLDAGFALSLAALVWREVLAGGNWRNLPVCILVTGVALADLGHHLASGSVDPGLFQRLALGCMALLLMLIGGRITPAFTRNWMKREGISPGPADASFVDAASLALGGAAVAAWVAAPYAAATSTVMALAGAAHCLRVARWRGWATTREPLVTVLHVAYAWIPAWLLLGAVSIRWPALLPASSAVHALTAGALGAMPLAVMTRAILGHTGRPLTADRMTRILFVLVFVAAVVRVAAHALPLPYTGALAASGVLWAGAYLLFLLNYAPMLWRRDVTTPT